MSVFLGPATVHGFDINDIIVYDESGKNIILKKLEKNQHQDDCWKGWLHWPNWKEIKLCRLFIILQCGHFYTVRCFFNHPFDRCRHCNYRLVNKRDLCEQLFNNIEKIKSSRSIMLKRESMFMLNELFLHFYEINYVRWTEIACFMFNFHVDCSIPCILVLEEIMVKEPNERSKIFRLISWDTIFDRTKVVIPMTESVFFLTLHLNFLKKSLLYYTNDKNMNEKLLQLKNNLGNFVLTLPNAYLSVEVKMLLSNILYFIKEEIERNDFLNKIEK